MVLNGFKLHGFDDVIVLISNVIEVRPILTV